MTGGRTERNARQRVVGNVLEGIVRVVRGIDERVWARQVRVHSAVDEGRRPKQEQRRAQTTAERRHRRHHHRGQAKEKWSAQKYEGFILSLGAHMDASVEQPRMRMFSQQKCVYRPDRYARRPRGGSNGRRIVMFFRRAYVPGAGSGMLRWAEE